MGASLGTVWLGPSGGRIVVAMENKSTYRLVVLVGSVREGEGRFGPVVSSWVAEQAAAHGGFEFDQLAWWASASKNVRAAAPYPA